MEKREFAGMIKKLEVYYPDFKISDSREKMAQWYGVLGFADIATMDKAMVRHLITSKSYKPTVSSLLQAINSVKVEAYGDPIIIFNTVYSYVKKTSCRSIDGSVYKTSLSDPIKPIVFEVFKGIDDRFTQILLEGDSYEVDRLRKEFISSYKARILSDINHEVFNEMKAIETRVQLAITQN